MKDVILIEDQVLLRELLTSVIDSTPDMRVVGQTGDGAEGYAMCNTIHADLIILDLLLPNLHGAELLARLKQKRPEVNVLICSGSTTKSSLRRVLKIGVTGFIQKSAPLSELKRAIQLTADGTAYFSAETVEMMRHLMQNDAHCDSLETLTSREREVAQLIAEGYTNKQIAAKLGMSVRTADTHRTNIMSKLDLANVAALTRWAIAKNLVDPGFGFFADN